MARVGSTQDEARRLYLSGERGPVWVRADEQTKGRGRLDRKWSSPSGNLFATLLLPNDGDPSRSALHGFAASLAIVRTLDDYRTLTPAALKWPNDVLINGAKISGLLIERESEALLIGIGINLVSHPPDTPYPASHLLAEMDPDALKGAEPLFTGADAVLATLSAHLMAQVDRLSGEGFEAIRTDWLERAYRFGETLTVNGVTGTFVDLAQDGALCLRVADGTVQSVHTGDVSFG